MKRTAVAQAFEIAPMQAPAYASVAPATEVKAYTIPEFAAVFKIGRTTIYEEIGAGRLKIYKVGKSTRISVRAANEWQRGLESSAVIEEAEVA